MNPTGLGVFRMGKIADLHIESPALTNVRSSLTSNAAANGHSEAGRPLDTEKVPDAQNHGPASVSGHDELGSRYTYLRGIPLYNLITALIVGMLLLGLDMNVVATAVPTISDYFDSFKDVNWYGSAFLLARKVALRCSVCATQPLAGKMYTVFPLKYLYVSFMALFELGKLICALSTSSSMVIAGRTVAGFGASGLFNGAVVILTACSPPKTRPLVTACGISMIAIGVLLAHCSVLVQLPRKLDPLGFALFAIASTMFLTAINWVGATGGATYPWSSAKVIGLLCGSGGILALFITWAIHQGDEALIPPHILRERNLFFGRWISGLQGGATIMVGYYLPLWFQAVKGASPTDSGLMMLPTMISQILGLPTSGALVRKVHYVPPWAIIGSVTTAVGSGPMTAFTADTSKGKTIGYQVITGFGQGAALNMHNARPDSIFYPIVASQEYLSSDAIAIASSAIALCQYLTGSVAISVAQAIFQNGLTPALEKYAPNVDAAFILDAGAQDRPMFCLLTSFPEFDARIMKHWSRSL
ncbi:putative MFS transporter [Aspergillus novofumigatus IBT 16806]|uniref:Putative MFS transporter n=1 Tax=Aspergillus novofumigatus (strain IBT 16806) TaxID=1392255 RepID=A0A2I1C5H1_ASPN1|nr:putative MFS transporter [Aspergillus novofumigatus IBT 16806]PKX92857.1 putative MFS transporter [Aspergillus novofumigatus IBT 16806]